MPSRTGASDLMVVTGPTDRFALTNQILVFCGRLPIYSAKVIPREFVWIDKANGTIGALGK